MTVKKTTGKYNSPLREFSSNLPVVHPTPERLTTRSDDPWFVSQLIKERLSDHQVIDVQKSVPQLSGLRSSDEGPEYLDLLLEDPQLTFSLDPRGKLVKIKTGEGSRHGP